MNTKKISMLAMSIGGTVAAGSFGYKMLQKGREKEATPKATNAIWVGVGLFSIGVALSFATGGKAIKVA